MIERLFGKLFYVGCVFVRQRVEERDDIVVYANGIFS